ANDAKSAVPAALGLSGTWEDEGEYDKAAATIDAALQTAPDHPDLLARRAELLAFRGRLTDAVTAADKAIAKQDDQFLVRWVQAGLLLLEKHNRGEALTAFDKALKINPRAPDAYVGKGLAALTKLELKDAEDFVKRALQTNPRHPAALHLAADMHLASGETAEAVKSLETAKAVNPRDETTLGKLAACLFLQKKQADLDALCAAAEKANPKAGRFYAELA